MSKSTNKKHQKINEEKEDISSKEISSKKSKKSTGCFCIKQKKKNKSVSSILSPTPESALYVQTNETNFQILGDNSQRSKDQNQITPEIDEEIVSSSCAPQQMMGIPNSDRGESNDEIKLNNGDSHETIKLLSIQDRTNYMKRKFLHDMYNDRSSYVEKNSVSPDDEPKITTLKRRSAYTPEEAQKSNIYVPLDKSVSVVDDLIVKWSKKPQENINGTSDVPSNNCGKPPPTTLRLKYPLCTSEDPSYSISDKENIPEDTILMPEIVNTPENDYDKPMEYDEPVEPSWKPIGIVNPMGYCYLNSVIQILVSCQDFAEELLAYDKWNPSEINDDVEFVQGFFDLVRALRDGNETDVETALKTVQFHVSESSFGDDVHKCFVNILARISDVFKSSMDKPVNTIRSLPVGDNSKAIANFERFQNKNPGFVFDNFYGQLVFQMVCQLCEQVCNQSFQVTKSLALPVPDSHHPVALEVCLGLFFNESDLDMDERMDCNCDGGAVTLKSVTKISHTPKYLFLYLNRGSIFEDGQKNDTPVTCGSNIAIQTTFGNSVRYKLISVIDHIGNNEGGHYYCKCSYETDCWWLLNDKRVDKLKATDQIVTNATVVFVFKKMEQVD